jgi:polar amino acid transport system substrate-binding protein
MNFIAVGGKALIAALLLIATAAPAEEVVFQSTDAPPYWSESMPENGLGGAILHLLSANAGVPYSIEYLPVKRYRNSMSAYIVGDPDILINQKHRAIFPIILFRSAFFYYKPHHDAIEFHRLADLKGHTLGVLRGTMEDKTYFLNNGISVEESDSIESLLKKLKRGRIDFCILVDGTGRYTIAQLFPAEQSQFIHQVIPGSARPIAIMIDTSTAVGVAIAKRYQRALDKTLKSREYQAILENFYGKNNIPKDRSEQLDNFIQYYKNTWDR